jgi:hypothetical protein
MSSNWPNAPHEHAGYPGRPPVADRSGHAAGGVRTTWHDSTPATQTGSKPGRSLSILGAVLAFAALLFLPIVLGPVGAVLGFVGYSKGDKLGMLVGIGAIIATVVGMLLGALVLAATR